MSSEQLNIDEAGTTAYVAKPGVESSKAVLVIQEYWGVNDHVKDIANRYADEGFIAIVPDLYKGKIATDKETASKYMSELSLEDGIATIKATIDKASETYGVSHFGINGFCMGGTFALRAACELEGISASAPFYGDIPSEDILKKLTAPTIFVSATEDGWINKDKVAQLQDITERYELPITSVAYNADHAFFNDRRPEVYNKEAAEDAWALVVGLFNDNL